MSFPQTRLENLTEILVDGVWTDITSSVRAASKIVINRGIHDELSNRAGAGAMQLTVDNRNGTFSDLNPASVYYGKIGRNTKIRHSRRHAYDAFARTSSNGWGTADSGQAWSTSGGVAGDYSVSGGTGRISNGSVNVIREVFFSPGVGGGTLLDGTISATLRPGVAATGAPIQMALEQRRIDASNYLYAIANFDLSGVLNLTIAGRVAGVNTILATTSGFSSLAYGAGSAFRLEFTVTGGLYSARLWDLSAPTTVITVSADDSTATGAALSAAGSAGCRCILLTGNTNVTPVVTFDDVVVQDIRFAGEVPEWPQRWDLSGRNVYVPLSAAGLLRRLTQGARKLQSVMTRATTAAGPVEFWPCEDSAGATQAANAVEGGAPLVNEGATSPTFGATFNVGGTVGGFTVTDDAQPAAQVRSTSSTTYSIQALVNIPAAPSAAGRVLQWHTSGGTWAFWALTIFPGAGVDTWGIEVFDADGVRQVFTSGGFSVGGIDEPYDRDLYIMVDMRQNGGNVEYEFRAYESTSRNAAGSTGSYAGTLGKINRFVLLEPPPPGTSTGWKYSQIGIFAVSTQFATWAGSDSYDATDYVDGFVGEDPVARMIRLCDENSVDLITQGASSPRGIGMGVQGADTLYNLLLECADVDQGMLYESRTQLGLGYRAAASLYSQTAVALDYTGRHLAPDIQPTSDDQYVRNDVTVARKNGSSVRIMDTASRLSVNDPPAGVGQYDRGVTTVNCEEDAFAPALIGQWLLAKGTIDEPRYPGLGVELASPALAANTALTQALVGLDTGDLLTVTNPPAWLPPFTIEALLLGYREEMGQFGWRLAWTTAPARPYQVIVLDSAVGNLSRLDSDASTLNGAHTSTTASLSVATATNHPLWTHADGDFDIEIGGERLTVTAVTGASSPQTFTVTRSVNGVVKAQASGATVQLWRPSVLGF